jgi:hypothetical protein
MRWLVPEDGLPAAQLSPRSLFRARPNSRGGGRVLVNEFSAILGSTRSWPVKALQLRDPGDRGRHRTA